MSTLRTPRTLSLDRITCLSAFLVVALAAILVRKFLPFEFPLPWPDEAAYIGQAYAFYRHGSFFLPALSATRVVLWVPPGYELVLAALFKLTGYAFGIARWASCLFYILDAAIIIAVARRYLSGWRLAAAMAASIGVFLTPYVIVDSNIARVEMLFLLVILGALWLCLNGRWLGGAALVGIAATLHYNAAFYCLPFAVFAAHSALARRWPVTTWLDWALAALAALILGAYAVFCLAHWHGFVTDMIFQFTGKAQLPFRATVTDIVLCTLFATLALTWLGTENAFTPPVILTLFATSFMLNEIIGNEMWYRYALSIGLLLGIFAVLAVSQTMRSAENRAGLLALSAVLALGVVHYEREASPHTAPLATLVEKQVVSRADRDRIGAFIDHLPSGSTVSFAFGFNGIEPFFFDNLERAHVTWLMQRPSADEPGPTRPTDWRVRCDSSLYARMLNPKDDGDFPREGKDTGCTIFPWKPTAQ